MIEQCRADEKSIFVAGHDRLAAIDHQVRTLFDAAIDIAHDAIARSTGDDGAHFDRRIGAGADGDLSRTACETLEQRLCGVAHGNDGRNGHAALAGRAIARADDGFRGKVEIGIGQHDCVILGAAQRLHTLAVLRPGFVDVACDRGGTHERNRLDQRMLQQRIDRILVAMHDVEHAVGQPRLGQQLGHAQGQRRVTLGGLQHKRVAARECHWKHPHRHHGRKIERRDAHAHAQRLAQRKTVDFGTHVFTEFAFQ